MAKPQRSTQIQTHSRQLSDREAVFEQLCLVLAGYDVESVAEVARVAPSTIYLWLNGATQKPRIDTLARVARVVGYDFTLVKRK